MQPDNPFAVEPPDGIPLEKFLELFCDVTPEFPKLKGSQHIFLEGARGSGKSMLFRYLLPDCQQASAKAQLENLEFYAVLVPIKRSDLTTSDLTRLNSKYSQSILNDYIMSVFVTHQVFNSLTSIDKGILQTYATELKAYEDEVFESVLARCTGKAPGFFHRKSKAASALSRVTSWLDAVRTMHADIIEYVRRQALRENPESYSGPIGGYHDFLLPLLQGIRKLPFMPKGPLYLLVDDADDLNLNQTKVLNSWVAARTTKDVCLKVSTQLRYKTYGTTNGQRVEAPHDFSLISMSSIYTSDKNYYQKFVKDIVKRRLEWLGIHSEPDAFFPRDEDQERKIKDIEETLRKRWKEGSGRGYRASDDVVRYARPEYMRSLAGSSKSTSTYNYAGLEQLIHISSGVIRHFLEPASRMYADALTKAQSRRDFLGAVQCIEPGIQNKIIRAYSSEFLNEDLEAYMAEPMYLNKNDELKASEQLRNLVHALGGLFKQRILSPTAAERKVFSIALATWLPQDLTPIFRRGVEVGYFHETRIGNKDGTGRSLMYVLNRRLAPEFYLDPTGFAGVIWLTEGAIREAIQSPEKFLRAAKKRMKDDDEETPATQQPTLF